jgi:hypothetical protein
VLAEAQLAKGTDAAEVRARLEPTMALSCQLSDPCWEAATHRIIGLTHEREGRLAEALAALAQAGTALSRVTDPYAALWSCILLDQARLHHAAKSGAATGLVRTLLAPAARTHADADLREAIALMSTIAARKPRVRPVDRAG